MKKILFPLLIIILFSCHHDKDEIPQPVVPIPACWEKFVGTYTVYDTANAISYIMKILHFSVPNNNGGTEDSIVVQNFANKFDFKYHFTCCYTNEDIITVDPPFPSYDHSGKRWTLFPNTDDTLTTQIENQLKNDTIILYFKMDNIAFYFNDGVPYYSANLKHIAVKQH